MAAFYTFSNHEKRMSPQVEAIDKKFKQRRERHRMNNRNHIKQSSSLDCQPDRSNEVEQRLISQITTDDGDDFSGSTLSALNEVMSGIQLFSEPSAPGDMPAGCLASDLNGSGDSLAESCSKNGLYNKRRLVFDRENGEKCSLIATLDTGCEVGNYVSEDIVKHLGKRIHDVESDSQRGFSATHHEIQVLGETVLFYTVGNFGSTSKFFVAKDSKMGLLLGYEELHKNDWLLFGSKNASAQPIYPMRRSDKPDESNTAAKAQQKAEVEKAEQERKKQAADARKAKKQTREEREPSQKK